MNAYKNNKINITMIKLEICGQNKPSNTKTKEKDSKPNSRRDRMHATTPLIVRVTPRIGKLFSISDKFSNTEYLWTHQRNHTVIVLQKKL